MSAVGRFGAVVLVLAWAGVGIPLACGQQKPDELTEQERQRLQKEAGSLNERAVKLYQQGQFVEATRLLDLKQARIPRFPGLARVDC
jgi:hypothetical protein